MRVRLSRFAVLLILAHPATGLGHDNFPRAQRLVEHPSDPSRLALAGTYGLVLTTDRGQSLRYICESSFALGGANSSEPLLELLSSGTLLAGTISSLNRSTDACSFAHTLGEAGTDFVATISGLSVEKQTPSRTVAILTRADAATTTQQVHESTDDGRSWQPIGTPIPARTLTSLSVAPSDSARLYATGISDMNLGIIAVSEDRGQSWQTRQIPSADLAHIPFVAAVHPTDPDVLYVRLDTWQENAEGLEAANDALLYSEDGGTSFIHIFIQPAKLLGVALSPDGSEILAGYGNSADSAGRYVDDTVLGIYKSPTNQVPFTFEKIYIGSVTCLTWTATGLYVCASQEQAGFEVGFSADATFTLASAQPLEPLFDYSKLAPLACANTDATSAATCADQWTDLCHHFVTCENAPASLDWGSPSGVAGSSSTGAGGTAGAGIGSEVGGATGTGATSATPDSSHRASDSGCACKIRSRGGAPAAWLMLAWCAAAGGVWRRRLRPRSR